MDNAGLVDDGQGREHLPDEFDGVGGGEPAALAQISAQVHPVHEVHHDREGVALGDDVANLHQVRVVEGQQDPALAQEPVDDLRVVGHLGPQDLDRHHPTVTGTIIDPLAPPDLAAGALPERLVQDVAGTQPSHRQCSPLCAAHQLQAHRPGTSVQARRPGPYDGNTGSGQARSRRPPILAERKGAATVDHGVGPDTPPRFCIGAKGVLCATTHVTEGNT